MSNLSELLPTGGGQNAVDFVASGTLASGQAVALNADGTVEAVAQGGPSAGSPVVFESADTQYITATYDVANGKIVIAYRDVGNSSYGTAIVGTVSGTSISFGTPVVYRSAFTSNTSATYDTTNNKVVIAYRDGGNSFYGTAVVGTVSGTSISFGTAALFDNSSSIDISATFDSNSNKVVVAYRDFGNSDIGMTVVGTVSGTSISFGTPVTLNNAISDSFSTAFDSTNNKVVVAYRNYGNSNYVTVRVGTVSGTSISFGTAVVFESANSSSISATFDSSYSKVVIAYEDGGNSSFGTVRVGTVSGTSISFGTVAVFESASTTYIAATYDSTIGKVVISYRNNGNSGFGTAIVGTVSGTSITFGSPVLFNAGDTDFIATTYDSTNNKTVIAYRDVGNANYGTGTVFSTSSSNNTDFIGITAEAISDTATGPVNVYGGINEVQTGLTIASDYYVQADGSLSTTSTSPAIKVGQAISATTINLMDLT